jgi:hypothetical protein
MYFELEVTKPGPYQAWKSLLITGPKQDATASWPREVRWPDGPGQKQTWSPPAANLDSSVNGLKPRGPNATSRAPAPPARH